MPLPDPSYIATLSGMERLEFLTEALDKQHSEHRSIEEMLNEWFFSFPLPAWLKNLDFVMIAINQSYTNEYGITLEQYTGMLDEQAWKQKLTFSELDRKVVEEQRPIIAIESLHNFKVRRDQQVVVCKWPVYWEGELIGPAGFCLEYEQSPKNLFKALGR